MKKLLLLAMLGSLFSGLQAQLSTYSTEKTTGVAVHEFGASATVINLTQGARLDSLWIGKNGLSGATEDTLTGTPTPRKNNIEIGFEFPFVGKTMNYCGLTAGGMLFFGERDSLAPAVNIKNQGYTYASDYVQFLLTCYGEKSGVSNSWSANPLKAGENACVRYEKVQDTFFIAYENLQAVDKFGNVLSVSFQYAFDKNGKLSFRPVSMEPQQAHNTSTGAYYWTYSWGLVGKATPAKTDLLYIKADGTSQTSRVYINVTQESHPVAGEIYSFIPPAPCAAVASPQVTNWAYEVHGDVLQFGNAMTWNEEASAALFILSTKSTLEGEDLPVSGKAYADGSTIGSSAFVTTGSYNPGVGRNYFSKGEVSGLMPATQYYLYAFPYTVGNCAGPVYNTTSIIPSESFRTYYKEPATLRVDDVTENSATLQVAVDNMAQHYLLAYDTLQLPQQTDMKFDETRTYAAGDEIAFGERKLKVLTPCAESATYVWEGLQQGKDYYVYAWSVNVERNWYSRGAASCGVTPVRSLPATMNFSSADVVDGKTEGWTLPAGWTEEAGNTHPYMLCEDTFTHIRMLSVQSTQNVEGAASNSVILSPYVAMGETESVKAIIDFYYWKQAGNEMGPFKPTEDDVLRVEYQTANGQWCEIAQVGSSAPVSQNGLYTLYTDAFTPKDVFRLRFTVNSNSPIVDMEASEERYTPYVGIRSLTFEASPCKAVSNLQVVDGSLSSSGVSLSWRDGNATAALEYNVFYKESKETSWNMYPVTSPRVQLTDLQAGGSYTAMVRSYCTNEDSALSQRITFALSSCAVPTSVRVSHLKDTSVDISWRGSGVSYAVIYKPRVGDVPAVTLYTEQTSISLTGLTPNTPYEVYVISYCGANRTSPSKPSTSAYFNTPVNCTPPELTIVEGSVTWQGVHIAIKAPVPECQVVIRSKDMERYPAEYNFPSTTKDTLKLYGFIDYENITYVAIARSLCIVDTSDWSEPAEFTTVSKPSCGDPSDLQARVDAGGRTATVSWTAGRNNRSWLLMHKEKSAQKYDSLEVRETSSTLYGLKQNTVYTWRVQASCDRQYLYSGVVNAEFSTADASLAFGKFSDRLKLRVDRNQIDIENMDGVYLKTLEVISMDGKRLYTYVINATDNVLIPHTLPMGPAVFRLTGGEGQTAVYKMMVR